MDDHQDGRLLIHQRKQWARKVLEERCTLKLTAANFNVSAKTAAKWVRRYPSIQIPKQNGRPNRAPIAIDPASMH